MHTILIVDDDVSLTEAIEAFLSENAFRTVSAHTAEDGVQLALSEIRPELVLLDVMIPRMGGIEACRALREAGMINPIIILSALGDTDSVVAGLEAGADDYLVKPYEERELLARIKAQLRRQVRHEPEDRMVFGGGALIVHFSGRQVLVDGEDVGLTPREFQLMELLVRKANRVVTSNELARVAWGVSTPDSKDNVKTYVHYIRRKIEKDHTSPRWIVTARGVGYRFVDAGN